MRVLLVNDRPPGQGSGTEAYLDRLAVELAAAGDQVDVLHGTPGHPLTDLWNTDARRRLRQLVHRFRPDVVHLHNVVRELSVSVVGAAGSVPRVMTVHDFQLTGAGVVLPHGWRRPALQLVKMPFDRRVVRRGMDLVLAPSQYLADRLRAAGFGRVEHLPLFAVPAVAEPHPVPECTDVVFAGRLVPEKGVATLVEAFTRIRDRHPGARLVLAGTGPEGDRFAGTPGVQVAGQLASPALSDLLGRARLVAVPTHRVFLENSPMVVLDAAAHGRPVVASDHSGLAETVRRLGCGLLVPPASPGPLAEALDRLLGDPAAARQLGDAGRTAAAQLTPARHVRRLRELYLTAGAGARRRRT